MLDRQIAVIDFGAQYAQLIVRRIRELGYYSRLFQPGELKETGHPAAIILSGGPRSTREENAPDIDFDYLRSLGVPVLGVCYGMQLLNLKFGGQVTPGTTREYGPTRLMPCDDDTLFKDVTESQVWMSHSDTCTGLAEGTQVIAKNQDDIAIGLRFSKDFYGIQFHPEVSHSQQGTKILSNFLALARDAPRFEIDSFKDHLIAQILREVNGREVVCGVSGGVDSTVLAVLLHTAGVKMRAIFVDTGLLRKDEALEVQENFAALGVAIETLNARDRFLTALDGVSDPEKKRTIIGNLFLDVFWGAIGSEIELFAQGTLYPDVIETASTGSIASKIKTHHNRVDRILALHKEGRVLEPLAELFKDEVRALGKVLKIPHHILWRHPFPGPGLAVRCPGEVTEEKLEIIREADAIFMRQLKHRAWYENVWQAYAALVPVKTVGVKGDERSYEWAISLRAVTSEDAMTADWARLPYELLAATSNEILNSVKGINRVLFDISTKPPASIEWE
ncbi:MAG: glutamine-hydrolyzing GMP synthase [Verrucomicrobiales bacterium]